MLAIALLLPSLLGGEHSLVLDGRLVL
jgi:hypothetical protein